MKQMKTLTVNGVTYTVTDPNAASIDDTAVGADAWSGKNIVDKLCPAFTESGATVTCEPVEGYPLTVTAEADATTITRCGKNLCSLGTQTFVRTAQLTNDIVLPAGNYYFSAKVTTTDTDAAAVCVSFYSMDGSKALATKYSSYTYGKIEFAFTLPEPTNRIYLYASTSWQGGAGDTATYADIQIVPGSVASVYELYKPFGSFAPGDTIPALAGVNTIFADAGPVTVTGRADPTAVINKLTNAIVALGGNI